MKLTHLIIAGLTVGLYVLGAIPPVSADPPGEQLADRVAKAYADVQQYQATARLTITQSTGGWTTTQAGDLRIALDRVNNRLLIDTPDQRLAADGQTLRYRHDQLPGQHLEVQASSPLTAEWVVQQAPMLARPILPTDVVLLIAQDPVKLISGGAASGVSQLPPDPDDPQARSRLQIPMQAGTMTLTVNPKTHLIDRVFVDVNAAMLGAPAGVTMSYALDFQVTSLNQPIDAQVFTIDTTGSIAAGSMQAMLNRGMGGGQGSHPMQGQDAPPLKLKTADGEDYDMANDDAQVIVLDFWATWCQPCVIALPELQAVYDWVQQENLPVAIYAVNQGETPDIAKQFWDYYKLSIPILMDEQLTATQSYHVTGIPETMIIAHGKVQHVHVGYRPGVGEQMKAQIKALLGKGSE